MDRRDFLKTISKGVVASSTAGFAMPLVAQAGQVVAETGQDFYDDLGLSRSQIDQSIQYMSTLSPSRAAYLEEFQKFTDSAEPGLDLDRYRAKMQDFETAHREDIFVPTRQFETLVATFKRLDRVQSLVGHGNFNVVSFDEALQLGREHSVIGAFDKSETAFIESIFSANAHDYGFFGTRVVDKLTSVVNTRDRKKVGNTGHYLFRGDAEKLYRKLQTDLENKVILTSGIRNIVKQTHLFLAKAIQSEGNLSRASRSLAPPGHSFHGIGDFDVGKIGFGSKNFTVQFAKTAEFHKLVELGYIDMRYPEDNLLGVRYEPWHIKVT